MWDVLILTGVLNQKIWKLSLRGIPYVPKLYIKTVSKHFETVYWGTESACAQNDRQAAFYLPLHQNQVESKDLYSVFLELGS